MKTTSFVLAGLSGAALAAAGYYAAPERATGPGALTEPTAHSGWVRHQDPAGFVVEVPESWSVQADRATGRAIVRGPLGEELLIWPVFVPGGLDAQAAAALLGRASNDLHRGARWQAVHAIGPRAVRLAGRDGALRIVAALTWIDSPSGAAAFIYQVAGTPERLLAVHDEAAQVLGSFRLVGRDNRASDRSQTPELRYITFREPNEGAWSLEIPEGWTPGGGLLRVAPVDVRHGFEAVSADGGAWIFSGDVRVPTYSLPTDISRHQGFVEGSPYSPGYGVRMEKRSYMPGVVFAEFYVRNYLSPRCGEITITDARDRPEAVQVAQHPGGQRMTTAGQVAFVCQAPGGARFEGMCMAQTAGSATPPYGGIWKVQDLFGYLATAANVATARQAMAHMLSSFRPDPKWVQMQLGVTAHASAATADTNSFSSAIIAEVGARRDASMDELARRRSNATLGVDDVTDPLTGRRFRVESGANYYWVDAAGNIAGTNTATAPSIDFRQLMQMP